MKELSVRPLQIVSCATSRLALSVGLVGLIIAPATAQQRPTATTNLCSTETQACSNAILSDGPLSVSADDSSRININTQAATLDQISDSVNEQTNLEENSTRVRIGPLDVNSGDRDRLGVRDNVRD